VVVVAAVLVVGDEQRGVLPGLGAHERAYDGGEVSLAELDVLGVLLRAGLVVGVEEGELP